MHAWRAVAPAAIAVDALNVGAERFVVAPPLATIPGEPAVEAASRDLEAPAKKRYAELAPVLGYEFELRLRRSILKRMTFFKSSCSS